jgi:hypothetical protein
MSKKEALTSSAALAPVTLEGGSESDLLTSAEYAHYRRCSLRTVERERETGGGCPYVRLGGRVLYRRADIQRYIEEHVRGHEISKDAALTSQHPNQRPKVLVRGDRSPGEA